MKIIARQDDTSKQYIENKLFEFNQHHFPANLRGRYSEIQYMLEDEKGAICGGVLGETCWNWLEIRYLFVEEQLRGLGYGTKLMQEIERMARSKQCDFIKVDTLGFQALDFYIKHGFEVYGVIENAGTFKHYYLMKNIAEERADDASHQL